MEEIKRYTTEITIETHSVTRITTRGENRSYCSECRESVIPILAWQAARALGSNNQQIEHLRLGGQIHEIQNNGICSVSLARYVEKENL